MEGNQHANEEQPQESQQDQPAVPLREETMMEPTDSEITVEALTGLLNQPPSLEAGLEELSNTVHWIRRMGAHPEVAELFLRTVNHHWVSLPRQDQTRGLSDEQHIFLGQIAEAVSSSARILPPQTVVNTGILQTWSHYLSAPSQDQNINVIGPVLVEFLQCILYARQCSILSSTTSFLLSRTWPLPSSRCSALVVLRYFYLRGCIHVQLHEWRLAVRCFSTAISLPTAVSKATVFPLCVEAWKKLVLAQCILQRNRPSKQTHPFALPKTVSPSIKQMLSSKSYEGASRIISGNVLEGATAPDSIMTHRVEAGEGEIQSRLMNRADQIVPIESSMLYKNLVNAYVNVNVKAYRKAVDAGRNVFEADDNMEIIRFVQDELFNRRILWFSRIYSAIALEEIVQDLGLSQDETIGRLKKLSEQLSWNIQVVSSTPPFVKFPVLRPLMDEEELMKEMVEWTDHLQNLDQSLAQSAKYKVCIMPQSSGNAREPPESPLRAD